MNPIEIEVWLEEHPDGDVWQVTAQDARGLELRFIGCSPCKPDAWSIARDFSLTSGLPVHETDAIGRIVETFEPVRA